jgi:hypothetical protein
MNPKEIVCDLVNMIMNLGFIKKNGIFGPAEQLSSSQEGLCPMEFVWVDVQQCHISDKNVRYFLHVQLLYYMVSHLQCLT